MISLIICALLLAALSMYCITLLSAGNELSLQPVRVRRDKTRRR